MTAVATDVACNTANGVGLSIVGYDAHVGLFRMNYTDVLAAVYDGYKVINMSWISGCNFN